MLVMTGQKLHRLFDIWVWDHAYTFDRTCSDRTSCDRFFDQILSASVLVVFLNEDAFSNYRMVLQSD